MSIRNKIQHISSNVVKGGVLGCPLNFHTFTIFTVTVRHMLIHATLRPSVEIKLEVQ